MNAMQVAQRITADEYLAYEGERRTWLVDGHVVMNQPSLRHQALHGRLFRVLDGWVQAGDARGFVVSPLDIRLDDHNVYAPDLLWYQASRVPSFDARAPYPLPDLAIEIRSPSTWRYDIGAKKTVYERQGLPELWLVDGDASVLLVSAAPCRRPPPSTSRWSSTALRRSAHRCCPASRSMSARYSTSVDAAATSANSGGPRRRERCVGEFGIRRESAGIVQEQHSGEVVRIVLHRVGKRQRSRPPRRDLGPTRGVADRVAFGQHRASQSSAL